MSRNCVKCDTEFKESIGDKAKGIMVIDKIPECWKDSKENGHCINCCNCYK